MDTKRERLKLDCAHRSLAPKSGGDQRPSLLIVNFTDKQRVMEAALWLLSSRSNHNDPVHKEPRISFFNDYSAEVVQRQKGFDDIKTLRRKMNIDYALLYPAILKVTVKGNRGDLTPQRKPLRFYIHWKRDVKPSLQSD